MPTAAPRISGFTFDPNDHRYFLDGVELPHVTGILKEVGLCPDYGLGYYHDATIRGNRVHEACELLDLGELDWGSLGAWPADWTNRVRAWQHLKEAEGFVPDAIEQQLYHPALRFAGSIDRRGYMASITQHVQPDIKSGEEADWHRYQTAGYFLLGPPGWQQDRRGAAYLRPDGTYRLVWHDDPNDLKVFMAALTITHARRKHR